jgi:hypothetical protein
MKENDRPHHNKDESNATQKKSAREILIAAKDYAQEHTRKGLDDANAAFQAAGGVNGIKEKAKSFASSIRQGFVPDANRVGPERQLSRFANLWRSGMPGKISLSAAGVISAFLLLSMVTGGRNDSEHSSRETPKTSPVPQNTLQPRNPDSSTASAPQQRTSPPTRPATTSATRQTADGEASLQQLYREQMRQVEAMEDGLGKEVMREHVQNMFGEFSAPPPQFTCRKCGERYSPPPTGIISQEMHCSHGGQHEPR